MATQNRAARLLLRLVGRFITPARFIAGMAAVCFLIAWNRDIALLYGLSSLLLALLLVSWILPLWVLRKLRIHRRQTGVARAGASLQMSYRFISESPLYFLAVAETIPGAERQEHFIPRADLSEPVTLSYEAPRRGVFVLGHCEVTSSWPFGFIRQKRRVPVNPVTITVVPRVYRIARLPQPHAEHAVAEGADSFLSRGMHSEFAGVRPYRTGDSLKHIHWGASARRQEMVVREYHSFDRPSWLMVVDAGTGSSIGDNEDSTLEYALQIAASVMEYARSHNIRLQVYVNNATTMRLTVEPGTHDIIEHLKALAAVQEDGRQSYQSAIVSALAEQGDVPVLMTVRRDSQEISPGQAGGHLDIVYNDASFTQPMGRYAEGWRQVNPGHFILDLHRLSSLSQVLAS
jgi:uncharacterized protein (DUF58 family)